MFFVKKRLSLDVHNANDTHMSAEKKLLIVESPSKAKTINRYLGGDYYVIASYGHVRDLSPKAGSVDPANDFSMAWEVSTKGKKQLQQISEASEKCSSILFATDPDREGEAISWHIYEILKRKKFFKDKECKRIIFHEITKKAVIESLENPRELNQDLVDAYMARRALDYLVGYTLSPVLWRKLPGARSAGRVQSAALRLICEREMQICRFVSEEYWSIQVPLSNKTHKVITKLTHVAGKKLQKKDIKTHSEASDLVKKIESKEFTLIDIASKTQNRQPTAPFTTSSLQQEASRKCYFSVSKTMQVAQKLYEGVNVNGSLMGLITYMRTDSVSLSNDAVASIRQLLHSLFGEQYVPKKPRIYKSKAKNAQEAHEAIRPTDITLRPDLIGDSLSEDERKLYQLIWNRTLASQMENAILSLTTLVFSDEEKDISLSAHGSQVKFDGFLKLYREDKDEGDANTDDVKILPIIPENSQLAPYKVEQKQHFTEAPPKYSEASLVKKMEEIGIGRPSTYATILKILQDREYVLLTSKKFSPSHKGMIVSHFLSSYYDDYFNYDFTAMMENDLDSIATGDQQWKEILNNFWEKFSSQNDQIMELKYEDVRENLDKILLDYFFGIDSDSVNKRSCPLCKEGILHLQLGRYGPYVGCSNYPECKHKQNLDQVKEQSPEDAVLYPKLLGKDDQGLDIYMKKGPYGYYVECEPLVKDKKTKPKRASIDKKIIPQDVTLAMAKQLLSLPRLVGHHPEDQKEITAAIGRFGPYLKWNGSFYSIGKDEDVLSIGMNKAIDIIATKNHKSAAGKVIGEHKNGGEILIKDGRYGPYLQYKKKNVKIPKNIEKSEISVEVAMDLLKNAKEAKKKAAK